MKFWRKITLFSFGGLCYVGMELLWRGRSHYSMFLAGGTSLVLVGSLGKNTRLPLPLRILAGAGIITAVEFVTGLLVNRDHRVWDYRNCPANFRGQICPQFCAVWLPVAAGAMGLYGLVEKGMEKMLWGRPAEG